MKTFVVDGSKEFASMDLAIEYAKQTYPVFARIRVYDNGILNKRESFTVWFH